MNKPPVLLIDFSALFRRAWHANSNGPVNVAFDATIGGVNRAEGMVEGCLVAICCDGKGNWRKELSKEYKADREAQPQLMYGEMDRTLDRLRRDGRQIWKCDGFEADDIIATATKYATTRGHEVFIASHDKDMMQLLAPGVQMIKTHTWEKIDAAWVRDKYNLKDERQLLDLFALCGDTSDGVKGAIGVGPAKAAKLLLEFESLDNIYEAIGKGLSVGTPGIVKSLEQHKDDVYLAKQLISLRRDAPIVFDDIYQEKEQLPISYDSTDQLAGHEYYLDDKEEAALHESYKLEEGESLELETNQINTVKIELPEKTRSEEETAPIVSEQAEARFTKSAEGDLVGALEKSVSLAPVRVDSDPVNPNHYKATIRLEAIQVIEAFRLNYNLGNAFKYIVRAGKKGAKSEDLSKAIWYINREIQRGQ